MQQRTGEQETRYALALKFRAEACVLQAKADVLENKDPSSHYELAAEYFRMHAEAEIAAVRKLLDQTQKR